MFGVLSALLRNLSNPGFSPQGSGPIGGCLYIFLFLSFLFIYVLCFCCVFLLMLVSPHMLRTSRNASSLWCLSSLVPGPGTVVSRQLSRRAEDVCMLDSLLMALSSCKLGRTGAVIVLLILQAGELGDSAA